MVLPTPKSTNIMEGPSPNPCIQLDLACYAEARWPCFAQVSLAGIAFVYSPSTLAAALQFSEQLLSRMNDGAGEARREASATGVSGGTPTAGVRGGSDGVSV